MAILILLGCLGKAAQLPLSFWLPDAMVAPAPVSALLHAATMVAAGPFLLIRTHILFAATDMALIAPVLLGGVTLVLGGLMALCADEPKRVLAYSTVSQLGLVIMSVGALAEEAGLYHLLSHAWFKAALFLGVGYLVRGRARQADGLAVSATRCRSSEMRGQRGRQAAVAQCADPRGPLACRLIRPWRGRWARNK